MERLCRQNSSNTIIIMCKTEKEKRLEQALIDKLKAPLSYSLGTQIIKIALPSVFIQRIYDKNGRELKDMTILEEASSGDFCGQVKIVVKVHGDDDMEGIMETVCQIDSGRFIINEYQNGNFTIDLDGPINLMK